MGGALPLDQSTSDLALITGLLDHGRYTGAVEYWLCAAAIRVSYLAGCMPALSGAPTARRTTASTPSSWPRWESTSPTPVTRPRA